MGGWAGASGGWVDGSIDGAVGLPELGDVRAYDLAVRLEPGMARHPAHPPFAFTLVKAHEEHAHADGVSWTAGLLTMADHAGTHVDALGHVSACGELHGGERAAGAATPDGGLAVASIEEAPPLVGPGHLVDAPALLGRELTPGNGIGAAELERWFDPRPAPGPGAIVLLRTGWMRHWGDPDAYAGLATGVPGLTLDGAEWLSEREVLAIGADTAGLERKTAGTTCLDVHVHLLVERGIHIVESLQLEGLAADGVTEFAFFAAPLRIAGGTGSPLRPLAFVPLDLRR